MDTSIVDRDRLFSVEGIVAVITGGGTGIGLMFAQALAANGARKVYIIGRRKEVLEAAAQSASVNKNVIPIVGDVTSKSSLIAIAERSKQEVGYIHLLICNSGYNPARISFKDMSSISDIAQKALAQDPGDWNRGFAINTTGVAFTSFAFLTLLDAGNAPQNAFSPGVKSQILVTTSIAAFNRAQGEAYHLTKAAATHLVKTFATTFAPYHIRVNCIAPGLFPTEMSVGMYTSNEADPSREGALEKDLVPAERAGGTSDMAGLVLYAASQAGAYVNGNVMIVDGGRLCVVPASY